MKKEKPEMVEVKMSTVPEQKQSTSHQPTSYKRVIAQIKTPHQTIEIYQGINSHLLHTILQGTQPHD